MAGGQQFAVGQGTLGASRSVALAGSAIAVSTGALAVAASPVDIALTGTAVTSAVGAVGLNRIVPLRSRKGGGGATSRLLVGLGATIAQGTLAARPQSALLGQAVASAIGTLTTSRTRSLTGISIQIAQTSIGPSGSGTYDPADVVFTQGVASSSQLPLPSGYNAGGFYTLASGSLPTGVTLTVTGLLIYDGIGVASATSATFSYTEPGALPTLLLESGAITGTLPYMATAYPMEGAVPAGTTIISVDDPSLRGSILSTWPDGSASVVVLAGHKSGIAANSSYPVSLQTATISDAPLTPAFIDSLLTSVAVNFGTPLSFTNFTSGHDRIWWANSQVICARYRLQITNKGSMEAVIDVHAFAGGRVFVEVVVENGRVDADAATVIAPATQSYTNATVSVNGTQIQGGSGVSSPTASMAVPNARVSGGIYAGGHETFRSWYCSAWVGGDPQLDVVHDATHMQAHPWFFKKVVDVTQNMQTRYSQTYDTYVPWSTCRLRSPGMDGSGGSSDEEIALFTRTNTDYLLTGNKYAARASIATGLARHTMPWSFRHTDGSVPSPAQAAGKTTSGGKWPQRTTNPAWSVDQSHAPASVLVPFLCRPSPCFIELAQKEGIWNHTNFGSTDGSHNYDQLRARPWRLRNYGMAAFLTPDADMTVKDQWRHVIYLESQKVKQMLDQPWNTLDALWEYVPAPTNSTSWLDQSTTVPYYQTSYFQHSYVIYGYHAVSSAKVLVGAEAVALDEVADRVCQYHLRWINEAISYEWRALPYQPTIGIQAADFISLDMAILGDSPIDVIRNTTSGTPPSTPGPWIDLNLITGYDASGNEVASGTSYSMLFYAAICCAVERGVSGADTAWTRLWGTNGTNGGVTNLYSNFAFLSAASQYNRYPRNK